MEKVEIIKPGTYWLCKSKFNFGIVDTDIFAKIISVPGNPFYIESGSGKVRLIRKTCFGFIDLAPCSMTVDDFLSFYEYLGKDED